MTGSGSDPGSGSGSAGSGGADGPLSTLDVRNAFVYVADAVRHDETPERVRDRGVAYRTVAASTHSPTSFASLVTGRHPPSHGVSSFGDRLGSETFRLFDLDAEGYGTRFVNSIIDDPEDPIFSVLDREGDAGLTDPLSGVDPPFVVVERGPGGHAPYGEFEGTAREYFLERAPVDAGALRSEYRTAVATDADAFERRLTALRDRGLLSETLVVYTSDHGELLGEGGGVGHNFPMRPELVYVPTVFVHPSLPTRRLSGPLRHADLVPTLLSALGVDPGVAFDGRPVVGVPGEGRPGPTFYEHEFFRGRPPLFSGKLSYEGVWDDDGGHVFTDVPRRDRLAVGVGKTVRSPKRRLLRRSLLDGLGSYWHGDRTYGTPAFGPDEARELLAAARSSASEAERPDLSAAQRERLRDLGYL